MTLAWIKPASLNKTWARPTAKLARTMRCPSELVC